MEVSGRQPGDQLKALRQLEESRIEITRANRERLRVARQILNDLSRERLAERQAARRAEERAAEPIRPPAVDIVDVGLERDAARLAGSGDHADLSAVAQAAALGVEDPVRARRVAELKDLHASGRLHSAERGERAAEGLLGQP